MGTVAASGGVVCRDHVVRCAVTEDGFKQLTKAAFDGGVGFRVGLWDWLYDHAREGYWEWVRSGDGALYKCRCDMWVNAHGQDGVPRYPVTKAGIVAGLTRGAPFDFDVRRELKRPAFRIAVTREDFAVALSRDDLEPEFGGWAEEHFYDSHIKLVRSVVNKHAYVLGMDTEDVVQDCVVRVRRKLAKYDPGRAQLSTFIWRVCMSVINSRITRKVIPRQNLFCPLDEAPEGYEQPESHLGEKMKWVVGELMDEHPDRHDLICALFEGDPRSPVYRFPPKISCSKAAHKLGWTYGRVHFWYRQHVTPLFRKHFAEDMAERRP